MAKPLDVVFERMREYDDMTKAALSQYPIEMLEALRGRTVLRLAELLEQMKTLPVLVQTPREAWPRRVRAELDSPGDDPPPREEDRSAELSAEHAARERYLDAIDAELTRKAPLVSARAAFERARVAKIAMWVAVASAAIALAAAIAAWVKVSM